MNLYATVTSERATKGQGGNDYLDIEVLGDKQQPIARMVIRQGEFEPMLEIIYSKNEFEAPIITRELDRPKYQEKGKRQKGEILNESSDIHEGQHKNCELCELWLDKTE